MELAEPGVRPSSRGRYEFLDFVRGEEAQKIFAENGYRPVLEGADTAGQEFPEPPGLFTIAGASAARAASDAAAEQRELAAALRRSYRRQRNYRSAALSEPLTAAALQPLADRGWRVLHDRRWPGSSRANVDHLVLGCTHWLLTGLTGCSLAGPPAVRPR